ncbi:glycosyltransferase family 1 protein [Patescibacteria group bacterium]|nr:MAG: glycosyltransferase family 1 protein [Patescibacteria group bacterium]
MPEKRTIILFSAFYDPWMSGAERCVQEVVDRLSDRYHFVLLTSRLSRRVPARETRGFGEIRRVGIGHPIDKWLFCILAPLAALGIRARVAHAVMESYAGIALWVFGLLRPRVRRVLTLQSGDLDSDKKQRRIPGWLWRRIHTGPDRVTAISGFLAARAARLGADPARVSVIANGVDLSRIAPQRPEERVRHRIVCIARLAWEKGLGDLLDALARTRTTVPDAHLVLVGDGADRAALEARAKELGIAGAVTFRGALPNAEALAVLRTADVFACPSLAEGLGIVFIEAQACGVPPVGTNVGGIPDVITDGESGVLVPAENPERLAAALMRVFSDEPLRVRLAAGSLASAARFDWEKIMPSYADLYERLGTSKNVLFATGIFPPAIGGPATYVNTVAPILSARGWRVDIVTYGDTKTIPAPPGGARAVVSSSLPPGVRHLAYFWRVLRRSRSTGVVFAMDPVSAGFPAALAALLARRSFAIKIVGDYAWEQGQSRHGVTDLLDPFQSKRYAAGVERLRRIQRFVVRRASRVVTPSHYLAGIVRQWGVPETRVRVVENAVDAHGLPPAADAAALAARAPEILSAGRFLPWKGMAQLVAALPAIRARVPGARLTLVGDGPQRTAVEAEIARLALKDAVTLTGRLPHGDVLARAAAARVFVLYTGYEGFSHQLVEALAAGAPVVSSDAGGNAEVARHEENALVVRYGDVDALVEAVVRLLQDADLSARLAAAGQRTAAQYTVARMTEGLVAALSDVP